MANKNRNKRRNEENGMRVASVVLERKNDRELNTKEN